MLKILSALVAGILFGLGLIISGMSNPGKVIGFLDIAGVWDPSLAFVMAGAIGVGVFGFAIAKRNTHTLLDAQTPIQLPKSNTIDLPLVFGSLLFGIGWGIAGICPGPALVLAGMAFENGLLFVVSMLTGMLLFHFYQKQRSAS